MADLEVWLEEMLGGSAADWQIDPQSILALQPIRYETLPIFRFIFDINVKVVKMTL